ncbi:MAG: DoxX family membrane protein [Desulfatitalea sp.]|nr:DoxX family membrane protein [Desulfatitalea sp.]NNJ98915.1 DoxX family membrane protein [Desulfatitalea sp.]
MKHRRLPLIRTADPLALAAGAGRIFLGVVFIYAAWDKAIHPADFAQAVANYQILPMAWVNPIALFLPWLELVCGLALIFGMMVRGSTLIVGILIIIFIGALGSGIVRGLDIHCGCFAVEESDISNLYVDLFRDLFLLAVAGLVFYRYSRPGSAPSKMNFKTT